MKIIYQSQNRKYRTFLTLGIIVFLIIFLDQIRCVYLSGVLKKEAKVLLLFKMKPIETNNVELLLIILGFLALATVIGLFWHLLIGSVDKVELSSKELVIHYTGILKRHIVYNKSSVREFSFVEAVRGKANGVTEYYEVRIKDVNNINKKIFEIPKGVAGHLKPSDSCEQHSRLSQKEELEKIFDDWMRS